MKFYLSLLFFIIICGTSSAQQFTSSYQGANFFSKSLNNALDFDGTDDCVITTLDVNYSVLPITTWEAWVFPTATDGGWRTIFGIEDGGWDRNVFTNSGYFYAGFGNGGWQVTTVNMNEWQHIAVVYNEASASMKFYKNGVAFTYSNSIAIPVSAQKFAIGSSQQSGPNQFFKGKISDVRVWNYERTQAQIQGSMNTELTGEEAGLIAYYPFKQGKPNQSNSTVTTLFDEVGTNNGNITNFSLSGTSSNFTFGKLQSRIPRNNLVMHVNPAWRRSYAGSGTALNDLTENGNNMTLLGSPIYSNTFGGVISLNGTNQSIQSVNNAPITGTNKRTVAMWVYPRSITSYTPTSIFSTGTSNYNTGKYAMFPNGDGTNNLSFWGHYSDFYSTGLQITMNEWNFIATTYNGNGLLNLHANGASESIAKNLNTEANKIDLFLNTNGNLGEMMIYDRDLSKSDLEYLYNRTRVKYKPDGLTVATAATSAKAIKTAYPNSPDGVYYIILPSVGVQAVYCLMDSKYDGGGWMMAMKATRGTTFNYDANYWYTANTLNPAQTNQNDGDAKFDVMNYFGTTDMLALWPDIPNVGSESGSIDNLNTWSWLEKNISGAPFTLINKFALSPTQQVIYTSTNGTMTFNGYGTPFSTQMGWGGFTFYGFNYSYYAPSKVRWGFSWNNETHQDNNDVSGGIGMASGSYSAGDRVTCCESYVGINRTARVEMYVR
jgi:hypothetical protein